MDSSIIHLTENKNKVKKKKVDDEEQWVTKLMDVIKKKNGRKISLPQIKKYFGDEYGIDMNVVQNRAKLKDALGNCVREKKLTKIASSFQLLENDEKTSIPNEAKLKTNSDYPSVDGIWLGLRVEKQEKAKTGRSTCKCCNKMIEKNTCRLKVTDNSLFEMCIAPGDHHEGVYRGYVEGVPPDGRTVSKKTFFIHENCLQSANEMFEKEFRKEWTLIQPHINESCE